jgi:uncharacterized protein (TIGR02453 family)
MSTSFDGFSHDLPRFLRLLARNNKEEWFDANRADYDDHYVEAAKGFVEAIGPGLKKLTPGLVAEPRINGAIMRINRDVRFSKDKTPYKTALHLIFTQAGRKDMPGYYMRISEGELGLMAGMFGFSTEQLAKYREAAADPRKGRALRATLEKATRAGPVEVGGETYKRVPKGFDPDHPNADLLRHKGLYLGSDEKLPDPLFDKRAVAYCSKRFSALQPLVRWLAKNVA